MVNTSIILVLFLEWVGDTFTLNMLGFKEEAIMALDNSEVLSESTVDTQNEKLDEEEMLTEEEMKREIYSMFLMTTEGNFIQFGDIVHGHITLLFFLRHFGWYEKKKICKDCSSCSINVSFIIISEVF